eukprot:FR739946.1.p1 GENE.FR739946.1~~FR739946.1.p1  ORF type:complete len:169 (+),score=6.46 FR739946.1:69-509(+)
MVPMLFPGCSYVIHVERDRRDILVSNLLAGFALQPHLAYATSVGSISANMEAYIDLIRFFEGCFPVAATSSKTVKYEDVVGGFANSVVAITSFLDLDWNENVTNFHNKRRWDGISTNSILQVHRPLYHHAVGRWRHYQRHLGADCQ